MTLMQQQRRLNALGYYDDEIDGVWGANTENGFDRVLTLVEKARNVEPPKPPAIRPAVAGNFALPRGFDPRYNWLGTVGTLPRILQEAIPLYGTKEGAGANDNPLVMAWAQETHLDDVFLHDSIAWCGLYAALVIQRSGYDVVAGPLWALNWKKFGIEADRPSLGDVLVFVRDGGGHVGFYVGEDELHYHVLGGNTGDMVKIARIAKARMKGARRPAYRNPLPSWKPYMLEATGMISHNEA